MPLDGLTYDTPRPDFEAMVADYAVRAMTGGRIEDPRQRDLLEPVRVVGLWAPAPQSGKTTAAEALFRAVRYTARVGFADPLREIIESMLYTLGVDGDVAARHIHDGALKEVPIPGIGRSFVELAIKLGTDVGRNWLRDTIWVDRWRGTASQMFEAGVSLVVCDDVRFENEAPAIREFGGVLIGIRRPGAAVSEQRAAAEGRLSFDDMDAVIDNDGDLATFESRVVETARRLGVAV